MGLSFAPMPLDRARSMLDGTTAIQRLLALDRLWTATLSRDVAETDREALSGIVAEMVGLLHELSVRVVDYPTFVRESSFDLYEAADLAIASASDAIPVDGSELAERLRALNWAEQIDESFEILRASSEEAARLRAKLELVESGEHTPGDLSRRVRRACHVTVFTLTVLGAAAEIGVVTVPIGLGAQVIAAAIELIVVLDEE